uniref:Ig-like domain-containing protein n=1 Tax=Haemonchus placei TaxID=6290 RepID=A0A158QMU4_HAEPC
LVYLMFLQFSLMGLINDTLSLFDGIEEFDETILVLTFLNAFPWMKRRTNNYSATVSSRRRHRWWSSEVAQINHRCIHESMFRRRGPYIDGSIRPGVTHKRYSIDNGGVHIRCRINAFTAFTFLKWRWWIDCWHRIRAWIF